MKRNQASLDLYQEIIDFVADFKVHNGGDSPTYRQIGEATGHGATTILWHLRRMDSEGLIKLPVRNHHGIGLPGEKYIPPPELDIGAE